MENSFMEQELTFEPGKPAPEDLAAFAEAGAERYNELEKAERNAAFLGKLERGLSQIRAGHGIVKTMEKLEAMEEDVERILKEFADDYERMAK